ncbi:MAG: symmetrical bis(5'-nucleosyl)-tetraphosphatase [Nitrospirae bacterium]|nr:MAG: symmetrical bis(5'-nucleosyl)-tetraphosphatase [Nitrospirota bacterium]
MSTYVIGDIQGCYDEFIELIEVINFNPNSDELWITGDLVNRGPKSLEVLRFVKKLGKCCITILGNHDIHLLSVAFGVRPIRSKDTFGDVIRAKDRDELIEWLRRRPLIYRDPKKGYTLIHAGLPPQWSIEDALSYASEAENVLRGEECREMLKKLYEGSPLQWSESLRGWERLSFIINCLVRLRFCDASGRVAFDYTGPPGTQPPQFMPWFEVPNRRSIGDKIIFGHWAALGFYCSDNVCALDSGCVWGGELTALRLEDKKKYTIPCRGAMRIGED